LRWDAPLARASGRGAGGEGRRLKRLSNRFKNTPRIVQNIVIPVAKHSESLDPQKCIPGAIGHRLVLMLTAVDLDNEPLFKTYEVGYVWTDEMLPPEFVRKESA